MSKNTINTIKRHSPIILKKSLDITNLVYDRLFIKYPQFIEMFKEVPKNQPLPIAEAFSEFAINIDNLKILEPALRAIAISHVSVGVKAEHYRMLGPIIINAIDDVLKDTVTIELIDAVREAYKYISDVLIEMESEIYKELN